MPMISLRRLGRRMLRVVLSAVDVYELALALYFGLEWRSGGRAWPVMLAANFLPWLLLPAFVLLPLALWRRRWPAALLYAAYSAAFIRRYGRLFLPALHPGQSTSPTLRLMSLNLKWRGGASPDRLLPLLAAAEVDVVALLEVNRKMARALQDALLAEYPYRVIFGMGVTGKALLSRYPIGDSQRLRLHTAMTHLAVTLDVAGQPVRVIVAHPPRPYLSLRGYRIKPGVEDDLRALAGMATEMEAGLLLGDFNMADQSQHYRLIAASGLVDSFREAGWGLGCTWPTRNYSRRLALRPFLRLDYLWHTRRFRAITARVGPDGAGSDHLPLVVELHWK